MDQELKHRIVENPFVDQLRNWIIDQDALNELCKDLAQLVHEWRYVSRVDKELVAHLFLIAIVTRNMAESLRQNHRLDEYAQVQAIELRLERALFAVLGIDSA